MTAYSIAIQTRREQTLLENNTIMAQEAPRTFQLAINYRSHGGIVQCAHSVIELITEFWPYAIDVLMREKGVVDGSKPVFFSGWDSDTVRYVWTSLRLSMKLFAQVLTGTISFRRIVSRRLHLFKY